MQSDSDEWQSWFNSEMPEHSKLPGEHQNTFSTFDRLILLRVMRPDRVTTALKSWIEEAMGKEYVTQKPFDMALTYRETSCQTPIFFVLFAGVSEVMNYTVSSLRYHWLTYLTSFYHSSLGHIIRSPAMLCLA